MSKYVTQYNKIIDVIHSRDLNDKKIIININLTIKY
jgi:hypothetical protein